MKHWLLLLLVPTLIFLSGCGGGSVSSGGGEVTHFSVSGPTYIPSGTSFNFTVTALDAANNTVPSFSGRCTLRAQTPTRNFQQTRCSHLEPRSSRPP